jgi:ubiquinone/menaquinone biosynthesis C-methylase UbiE
MGLAQKLLSHHHEHGDGSGGEITRPRGYELFVNVALLGQRARIWDRLVALSGAGPSDRVLDVGCGTGYFARRISPRIEPGGTVVGIDPSRPMLDYASRHAPANCTFLAAGAERLPFEEASFDVVVSSLAFHHFPVDRRAEAVREMFRVLRPGGRLFIADFRPPGGAVLGKIVGAFTAHAMADDNADEIREFICDSGFTITAKGDTRPMHHISARRPPA